MPTSGTESVQDVPWMRSVASPPSSTSRSGPEPSGQVSICSVHHQYSSRVSPFHAKTAAVSRATAAAAWSCTPPKSSQTSHTAVRPLAMQNSRAVVTAAAAAVGCWRALAIPMIACNGLQSSLSHCRAGRQGAKQHNK